MTPEQKQKLIEAYKKADLEYESVYKYDNYDMYTYVLSGRLEGMFTFLEILGLIDSQGNLIE